MDGRQEGDQHLSFIIIGLLAAVLFVQLTGYTLSGVGSSSEDDPFSGQCENKYFATSEDGRLIPMTPLGEKGVNNAALTNWASLAVSDVMTFGFHDYRSRFQENSKYFSSKGWESFSTALERARIIEMIEVNQQVVTAAAQGVPVIVSEGVKDGVYEWNVQVPTVITYQSGSRTRSDRLLVTLVIKRSSAIENKEGLAIEQWIATPR